MIEEIADDGLDAALAYVLAAGTRPRPADPRQVRAYRAYLDTSPITWRAWRLRRGNRTTGVFFALLLPGSTAIVMIPPVGVADIAHTDQQSTLRHGLAALASDARNAQVLLEPEATDTRQLIEASGFRFLTRLLYLQREQASPPAPEPPATEVEWLAFGPDTYAAFARTIQLTYEESLDCPELTGLRSIHDVIASHQATGRFDPRLWQIAQVGGRPAGCLLLAVIPAAAAAEVVYMGVVPEFRGIGVGGLLLRRALQQCGAAGQRFLTLVVDARNAPARRLYDRFGFRTMTVRDAFLLRVAPHEPRV